MSSRTELVFCIHTRPFVTIVMGACPKKGNEVEMSIKEEKKWLEKEYNVKCHIIACEASTNQYIKPAIKQKTKMHKKWITQFEKKF